MIHSEFVNAQDIRPIDGEALLFVDFSLDSLRILSKHVRLAGFAHASLQQSFADFLAVRNEGLGAQNRLNTRFNTIDSSKNNLRISEVEAHDLREALSCTGLDCTLDLESNLAKEVYDWFDGASKRVGPVTGREAAQAVFIVPIRLAHLPNSRKIGPDGKIDNPFDYSQKIDRLIVGFYNDRGSRKNDRWEADHQPTFPPMLFSA